MLTSLRQGHVASLRVTVARARSLDEMPHDVYLVDLTPASDAAGGGGRFDEVSLLECLEPVLDAAGGPPSWVVDVARSHRSDHNGLGEAHLSILLADDENAPIDSPVRDLTGVVRAAFAVLARSSPPAQGALSRGDAISGARAAVAHAFPGVDPQGLSLTDEEHHQTEGRWSVGLAQPGETRYQVQLGFVPEAPASAHVHRMPLGEVVDSVGP
ncbi:hypothetical protein FHX52_1637 [Humibacillus xanthopallidus]|uniref:Uncharacterized protein n=1 Tax=Humibacillus xanthopallidus TaxID=412689 RepID=A0A543PWT3_9MICO|nr:hypothetical protein [Humibacillus xanthopallidus]TQN48500.1 hypothetical protein FHX52_1637 [Humibacillus xanthopallidus]